MSHRRTRGDMRQVFMLAMALTVSACTTTIGESFDIGNTNQLAIGLTTTEAAVALLGPPNSRDIAADGSETWRYLYARSTGGPTAVAFVPYVGPFLPNNARVNVSSQQLTLVFSDGVLSDCTLVTSESAGEGGGVAGPSEALIESMTGGTTRTIACGRPAR